jgi:hypothetical protein
MSGEREGMFLHTEQAGKDDMKLSWAAARFTRGKRSARLAAFIMKVSFKIVMLETES